MIFYRATIRFAWTILLPGLLSAMACAAEETKLTAVDQAALAQAAAPGMVRVEYTLRFDKGEPPVVAGWGKRCPHCGEMHSIGDGSEFVEQERPDAGAIEIGESVVIGYVDQHRDALDGGKSIFEEIADGKDSLEIGGATVPSRSYIAKYNFRGAQQQKKVAECSGGERNRIHLAKMLRRGGNLLLLDEPTNDLDVDTMRVLEQAIIDFQGCAMVISHDRFFLDRICTHLLVFEGGGKTQWFQGNFAAYEEKVRAENPERLAHRRSKYKKLKL